MLLARGCPFVLSLLFAGFGLGVLTPLEPAKAGGGTSTIPNLPRDSRGDPLPSGSVARLGTTRLRQHSWGVTHIAYSPKGDVVAAVCDRTLRRWETASGKELAPITSANEAVYSMAFFPDGQRLALLVADRRLGWGRPCLRVFDLRTSMACDIPTRFNSRGAPLPLVVSPDGKQVAMVTAYTVNVWDVGAKKLDHVFPGNGRPIYAMAYSPDGKCLAFANGRNGVRGVPDEQPIFIGNITSGKVVGKLSGHKDGVHSVAYSPDGSLLVSAGRDDRIRVWDVHKCKEVRSIRATSQQIALDRRGSLIASCEISHSMKLWEVGSGKLVREFPTGSTAGSVVAISPDGKQVAVGGHAATIGLWNVATGKEALPFDGHRHAVFSLAFSPDGRLLASRGGDQTTRLWDVTRFSLVHTFPMRTDVRYTSTYNCPIPEGLAFSPNGTFVAAAGVDISVVDPKVYLWDVGGRKLQSQWLEPRFTPLALGFTPDSKAVVTSSGHGVKVRAVPEGDVSATLEEAPAGPKPSPNRFAGLAVVSPTGHLAALCRPAHDQIRLWDYKIGREVRTMDTPHFEANHAAFSPDGRLLVSGGIRWGNGGTKRLILWEVATGTQLANLGEKKDFFHHSFALSPDGRLLASIDHVPLGKPRICVWNVFTGAEVAQLDGHKAQVLCIAFSPDGKLLATGSADTTILLWDTSKFDRRIPATKPDTKELERLWIELQSRDGAQVWTTLRTLIGAGDAAVALLAGHLNPVAAPDAKAVRSLLTKLEADEFPVRDAATKKLLARGDTIEPLLQEALKKGGSLEFTKQVRQLVQAARSPVLGTEQVRQRRALLVLGQVGSKAARACLQRLAAGAPAAGLTREARATLDFLKRTTHP